MSSNKPGRWAPPIKIYPAVEQLAVGAGNANSVFAIGDRPDDPQIMLPVSYDGGATWEAAVSQSLGAIGQYRTRVRWHRLGSGENLVLRFAISDPVPMAALDLQIAAVGSVA